MLDLGARPMDGPWQQVAYSRLARSSENSRDRKTHLAFVSYFSDITKKIKTHGYI